MANGDARKFGINESPARRTAKLNSLAQDVCEIAEEVEELQQSGVGGTGPVDPGDLTVYYDNGKA